MHIIIIADLPMLPILAEASRFCDLPYDCTIYSDFLRFFCILISLLYVPYAIVVMRRFSGKQSNSNANLSLYDR